MITATARVHRVLGAPWVADVAMVAVMIAFAVAFTVTPPRDQAPSVPWWWADLVVGVLAALLLLARRRFLLPIALVIAATDAVVTSTGGTAMVVLFLIGRRHRLSTGLMVAGIDIVAAQVQLLIRMSNPTPSDVLRNVVADCAYVGVALAWGTTMRVRAELLESLRERAEHAEVAAHRAERTRIAREMHDVLAHRISLLAMHAGSLTHRRRLEPDEVRAGLDVIGNSARAALDDLHTMLRVLREPDDELSTPGHGRQPPPTLTDLTVLVDSVRASGVRIETCLELENLHDAPETTGRTLYRVAQEALTNAAKHAPGCPVTLSLSRQRRGRARLVISNPLSSAPPTTRIPGTRSGLIGIRERIELAGGSILTCGRLSDELPNHFVVDVEVPWPS